MALLSIPSISHTKWDETSVALEVPMTKEAGGDPSVKAGHVTRHQTNFTITYGNLEIVT